MPNSGREMCHSLTGMFLLQATWQLADHRTGATIKSSAVEALGQTRSLLKLLKRQRVRQREKARKHCIFNIQIILAI